MASAVSWLMSQLMNGVLWNDKKPDGNPKSPWAPSPSKLPYIWNAYDEVTERSYRAFTDWSKELGDLISVKIGQKHMVVLNKGSLVQEAFVRLDQNNSGHSIRDGVEILMTDSGKTVFSAPFTIFWVRLRRSITIILGTAYVKRFDELFSSQAAKLVQGIQVERAADNTKSINAEHLRQLVNMIAMDTSLAIVVGQKNTDPATMLLIAEKCKEIEAIQSKKWYQYGHFINLIQSVYNFITIMRKSLTAIAQRNTLLEVFFVWVEPLILNRGDQSAQINTIADSLLNIYPSKNDPEPVQFTTDEVIVNLVHITLHSYKNLSSALFTLIQRLASMPELQERIYEEVLSASNEATLDDWPLIRALISESMRYEPPVRMFSHASRVDHDMLDDNDTPYRVDDGTEIIANLDTIHFDPQYYPDPHTFNPDRFLVTEKKSKSILDKVPVNDGTQKKVKLLPARDHLAFGAGRRKCQGAKASERMLGATVARLVKTYKLEGGDTDVKVDYQSNIWGWTGRTETKGDDIKFISR
ncbi:cytochrome P450 [Phycomyces nitens]|nr:cytochrome P450 [Phycomyces nitens]